jgi:pilus assembly protein Flp/PilA
MLQKLWMEWLLGKFVVKMKEEEGQALAEYGLIIALIAVVCIAAVTLLGTNVDAMLTALANAI